MDTPTPTKDGLTFFPIPEFRDVDLAFSTIREDQYFDRRKLPSVPREYEREVERLFYDGGKMPDFAPEVDKDRAARWTRVMLSSWEPSHESKLRTVAYAFWVWSTPDAVKDAR